MKCLIDTRIVAKRGRPQPGSSVQWLEIDGDTGAVLGNNVESADLTGLSRLEALARTCNV